tara:strand:- start:1176 stop:2120 length:945 start_codon:yes stop_codon:yes gene_type:complete
MKASKLLMLLGIVSIVVSCETDDVESPVVEPAVSLEASDLIISEDGGTSTVTVNLNVTSSQAVDASLAFSGTATTDDYSVSNSNVSIASGQSTASVVITALQDTLQEGNETIEISIQSATGAEFDPLQVITITIEDDDVAAQPNVLLNEILYDPSNSGLEGDANGDGQYAQSEDEFLEFVNMSSQPLDMSGWMIFDAENYRTGIPNHLIPNNTVIQSGKAFVVFGGGTPTGTFGGATVQTSTSGDLNMNNAGDTIYLVSPDSTIWVEFDIEPLSNNPNSSYSRNPDLTGEFEQHENFSSILFSPGTHVDGTTSF